MNREMRRITRNTTVVSTLFNSLEALNLTVDEVTREEGVPVIAPVCSLNDKPEGSVPSIMEKESAYATVGTILTDSPKASV